MKSKTLGLQCSAGNKSKKNTREKNKSRKNTREKKKQKSHVPVAPTEEDPFNIFSIKSREESTYLGKIVFRSQWDVKSLKIVFWVQNDYIL